jgi:hypothetical protein
MKTHCDKFLALALAVLIPLSLVGCSEESNEGTSGPPGSTPLAGSGPFGQLEQIARPGINEALLISQSSLQAYNAAAPAFAGVPDAAVTSVVNEAKTTLKAIYLGACLLNGALGLSAADGVKPAGITCHAVGPAVWKENALDGVTLTEESVSAAQAYADKVAGQFLPDVMRIDTSVASNYLTLCSDGNGAPLLCGGRALNDDVIDVTYNYLINGAATTKGPYDQVRALTSDGVQFSSDDSQNSDNVTLPVASNTNQFHKPLSDKFPYSAAPY